MNRETYEATLMDMVADLDEKDIDHFIDLVQSETKNPVTAFGLSLFLGLFGVDRFYIGDLGAGFLKLITLGGAGIWYLIDLFKIAGRTRDKSFAKVEVIFNQIYERRNRKKG